MESDNNDDINKFVKCGEANCSVSIQAYDSFLNNPTGNPLTLYSNNLWSDKDLIGEFVEIPFIININIISREKLSSITHAIDKFNALEYKNLPLPVKFRKYSSNYVFPFNVPYVEFQDNGNGNTLAPTYKQEGKNVIKIGEQCQKHDILHEMMHVLGFQHQHQSFERYYYTLPARDDYPLPERSVDWMNGSLVSNDDEYKKKLEKYNFFVLNCLALIGIPITPYDYKSITHYPCNGIMLLKSENISPKPPTELSEYDKAAIAILYGRPICTGREFQSKFFQSHYQCDEDDCKITLCMFCASNNHHPEHRKNIKLLTNSKFYLLAQKWNNVLQSLQIPNLADYVNHQDQLISDGYKELISFQVKCECGCQP